MKTPSTRPVKYELRDGFVDGVGLDNDLIHVTPLVLMRPVRVNVPFEIELPGLGTTGYSWQPRTPHVPIEFISDEAITSEESFGSPGKHIYRCISRIVGTFRLCFDSKRPWEDSINESREYSVTVKEDTGSD